MGLLLGVVIGVAVASLWWTRFEVPPRSSTAGDFEKNDAKSETSADIRTARDQIHNLELVLLQYAMDCGRIPTTVDGLFALTEAPHDVPAGRWQGPYLDEIPLDPWKSLYRYESVFSPQYRVWSLGPDGLDGTEDDVEGCFGQAN